MAKRTKSGTLSSGAVFSYSLGDVANNLSFMMTSMFLMIYMTDIVGIEAGIAGAIYGVTKIWAGVTDLMAGSTVDKANTRWGRLRPWLLWISTPLAIMFVLLFSVPAGLSGTATIVWILLFDAAFQLCYSFINIPYGSLSAAMTQDATDRSRLSGARSIAAAVTTVALTFVVAPQFNIEGSDIDQVRIQFTVTMLILAVIAVILYLICFKNTREVVPRAPGKMSMGRTLKMVRQNRPLLVLITGALFMLASAFTLNAVAMYYARDVLGNAAWYPFLTVAQTVGTILIASALPRLTSQFGKRLTYVFATLIAAVGFLLIYFIPEGSLVIALVAWFLYGMGNGGSNAAMFSMQADTVDYGQWKTGIRSEGGSYSVLSFVRKVGQGIGGWAGGAVIAAFGYSVATMAGGDTAAIDQAQQGIRIASGLIPAGLAVIAALIMLAYNLDGETHRKVVQELNERRTRSAAGAAMGVETSALRVETVGDGRNMRVHADSSLPIVTIFESDGSGGTEIGPRVAEALGVPFTAQRFSSEQLADTDDEVLQSESGFDRFLRSINYTGTADSTMAQASELSDRDEVATENTQEILQAVANGGVVMGRNATIVLNQAVGALHVRLTAPIDRRVERVAHLSGLNEEQSRARIRHEEELRAYMSKRLYNWDPFDDEYYDLVINTATVTYEQVVEMIVTMYRSKYPEQIRNAEESGAMPTVTQEDLDNRDKR